MGELLKYLPAIMETGFRAINLANDIITLNARETPPTPEELATLQARRREVVAAEIEALTGERQA